MARSTVAIIKAAPAALAVALVLAVTLGTLAAVAWRAETGTGLSTADWQAIRFTIVQAIVSAFVSVLFAIPVARALARRTFWGRGALITLLGAPFLLPVIVAVLGLLAVFGRNGILNSALAQFGIDPISIYGFHGVVLAHVFFNLPLATRMILQGWLSIPAERFRLAASLNAPVGRFLEWPMLKSVLPGITLVIFLICLTSFAVALTLGGGPKATTIELAIFQALRFDFDLERAALLGCIQFALCATAAFVAFKVTTPQGFGAGLDRTVQRYDTDGKLGRDGAAISCAAAFLLIPLAMVVIRGVPGLFELPPSIFEAAFRSVLVALASTILCIAMALALSLRGGMFFAVISVLPLAASALVVGTGLFIIVFPFTSPASVALAVTVLVNATLALPFVVRSLEPSIRKIDEDYGRLAQSLSLTGWTKMRLLTLPRLRRPLGFAAGLVAALSMGDLGVIILFAGESEATLPLAMYRLMGAYRMDTAAGAGLLLLSISLLLFWIFDRGGRINADA